MLLEIRMSEKPKTKEKSILELVQWIDDNESKVVKIFDVLGGMGTTLVMLVIVLFVISEIVNFTISDFGAKISIQLTSLAILIAFFSLVMRVGEKGLVERRFGRAIKEEKFSDREKPLLKALIKIKSNNEEIKLMMIYEMDKEVNGDIFTEKKLLESICK
jgi:ABC-type uncharacterized transport system fused permease/ATPase subunit